MRRYFTDEQKIEICDYYSNHTEPMVIEKYGVDRRVLHSWRKKFGYPSKIAGTWPKCRSKQTTSGGYIVNGKYVTDLPEITPQDTVFKIEGNVVPMRVRYVLEKAS